MGHLSDYTHIISNTRGRGAASSSSHSTPIDPGMGHGVPNRGRRRRNFSWGVYEFTETFRKKKGEWYYECRCPYHKYPFDGGKRFRMCSKELKYDGEDQRLDAIRKLKLWAVEGLAHANGKKGRKAHMKMDPFAMEVLDDLALDTMLPPDDDTRLKDYELEIADALHAEVIAELEEGGQPVDDASAVAVAVVEATTGDRGEAGTDVKRRRLRGKQAAPPTGRDFMESSSSDSSSSSSSSSS